MSATISTAMKRTLDGFWLFLALVLLTALVYAAPDATLKWAALAGLAFLSLATLPVGRKERSGAPPTRRRGGGGA